VAHARPASCGPRHGECQRALGWAAAAARVSRARCSRTAPW
jgi:hypothetical protein